MLNDEKDLLPNRIREHRKRLRLRLADVAAAARCSIVQVSDLERGNRNLTVEWAKRIGQALGVDAKELMLPDDNFGRLSVEESELVFPLSLWQ